jgi:hypothetical protein
MREIGPRGADVRLLVLVSSSLLLCCCARGPPRLLCLGARLACWVLLAELWRRNALLPSI